MLSEELVYLLALSKVDNVGCIRARMLVDHFGSAKTLFEEVGNIRSKSIPVNSKVLYALQSKTTLRSAEAEMTYADKNGISIINYKDDRFPVRLKHQMDAPFLLYYKGNADLNAHRIISIVGSRKITEYGKSLVHNFISSLAGQDMLVVSGLAYGVDSAAHSECVQYNIPTIGILGHGLDQIYPSSNKALAKQMIEHGGLLSEFGINTRPDREHFPMRNRIIAGMCDALIVVETGITGGSMITAEIANSYNKDVFAFPGRTADEMSRGCNKLIKENKAGLIENATDLMQALNWNNNINLNKSVQKQMFPDLNIEEQSILNEFSIYKELSIDHFHKLGSLKPSKIASSLISLEFKGVLKELPGKMYKILN